MNPVGSKGTRAKEPKKNPAAARRVSVRCFRHHAAIADRPPSRTLDVTLLRRLQKIGRHHRREHARHDQREEHRNRRAPAKLHKELAGTPLMNAVGKNTAIR